MNTWRFKLEPDQKTGAPLLTILDAPDGVDGWAIRRAAMQCRERTPEDEYRDLIAAATAYEQHALNLCMEAERIRTLAQQARAEAMKLL